MLPCVIVYRLKRERHCIANGNEKKYLSQYLQALLRLYRALAGPSVEGPVAHGQLFF